MGFDALIFVPDDVDLARSPLRASLDADTFVLGAFNPGLTRLPNGDLLMMVRVAEALRDPVEGGFVHALRWTPGGYRREPFARSAVTMDDPRQFQLMEHPFDTRALTSLSWLLPVRLSPDGTRVLDVHYQYAVEPSASYQEYAIEDARISSFENAWWMTVCSVSAERHGTSLYRSDNGLDWTLLGLILDHQNKDMLLFEGRIDGFYNALTRPLGDGYFAYPPDSPFSPGPCIQLARSPDALHWKPSDAPGIRPRKGALTSAKVGGGTPPVLTPDGWLTLYHGVERNAGVGVYRTFWALLDRDEPARVLRQEDGAPLLEARTDLTQALADRMYLSDIVFSCGIAEHDGRYVVASGEADLACRITHIAKSAFA